MDFVTVIGWAMWTVTALMALYLIFGCRLHAAAGAQFQMTTAVLAFLTTLTAIAFLILSISKLHLLWVVPIIFITSLPIGLGSVPLISPAIISLTNIFIAIILFGVTGNNQTSIDIEEIKKVAKSKERFMADIEMMAQEIMDATKELVKEMENKIDMDPENKEETLKFRLSFFINVHDRILLGRLGQKARSWYIDGIADKLFDMMTEQIKNESKGSEISHAAYRKYLNDKQRLFMNYPEIVSDSNSTTKNLTWHVLKYAPVNINGIEDFALFLRLYGLTVINIKAFSVNTLTSVI